jgi:hypothetical protein
LYSWLLAPALKIVQPSIYWEFPVVHFVNLAIYLGALASFEFLLSALVSYHKRVSQDGENALTTLPEWAWYGIGYPLFLWTTFSLIGLGIVTPDLCIAACAYLASGLVLRIRAGSTSVLPFALLGIVLGFGYLAKAIFFPLALIFLGISLFSVSNLKTASQHVLIAGGIFAAISAPFIVALSLSLGHPTIGESGKYNYIMFVDTADYWVPSNGFIHPIRKIYDRPIVNEFARPDKSTFPLWYNPEYWWEGYRTHFNLKGLMKASKAGTLSYYNFLFLSDLGLVAGLIVLFCASPRPRQSLRAIFKNWHLLIPALAGLGAFFVLHVDSRYIAAFVALLWLGILSGVRIQDNKESRKVVAGVALAVVVTVGGPVLSSTFLDAAAARHKAPVDWEVAQALNQVGINRGDLVGMIRHETPSWPWADFYWARLARIRITAEIPPEEVDKFWASSPAVQAEVMNAFESVGAKAIITSDPPAGASTAAWHKLGNTDFYAYVPRLVAPLSTHN